MKIIVATDSKGGIAKDGKIPWKCPEDMGFFKTMTIGGSVVMGRKTFETLKSPLPFRKNYVVTSTPQLGSEDLYFIGLSAVPTLGNDCWIIGGEQLYSWALTSRCVDEVFISRISGDYECDQFMCPIPGIFACVTQLKLSEQCTVFKYVNWTNFSKADKLGLLSKLNKVLGIQEPAMQKTEFNHVFKVKKGTVIEETVIADKDGYVWYDETEQLGLPVVYTTAEAAHDALMKYVKEVL